MPGKICYGATSGGLEIRNSKAYCDGMKAKSDGSAITANPWDGTGTEEETAWDAGWNAADAYAGGSMPVSAMGCCSVDTTIPS